MTSLAHRQPPPNAQEMALARISGKSLSPFVGKNHPLKLQVTEAGREQPLELPPGAVTLLMDILEAMAAGRGVTIIPENAELTTVQAADLLNVSRPFLIKLLDEGEISFRKVGKHRRILMEDVMAYKTRNDQEQDAILDQLVAEGQAQE